jgi:hypothetical protein
MTAWNGRKVENYELGSERQRPVVAYLSYYMPGKAKENYEKPHSKWPASGLGNSPGLSKHERGIIIAWF